MQFSNHRSRAARGSIVYLAVDAIAPSAVQPRQNFSPAQLEELSRSIAEYGVLSPLTVRLGKSQSAVANKLRLLRLETPQEQREALAYILSRDLNVAATDAYIERLLEAKTAPESEQQKTFILKDVRVFLNTISHSLDLMKQGGIDAGMRRQETDEALILTINIPKARRREPAPKQAEPVPVG